MSFFEGDVLLDFWDQQAAWSEATFGPSSARGPRGPLKHLKKEIEKELLGPEGDLTSLEEYADLLFLVFDATRRAGFSYDDLVAEAFRKLEVNKARRWPDWRTLSDEPVEHVRE